MKLTLITFLTLFSINPICDSSAHYNIPVSNIDIDKQFNYSESYQENGLSKEAFGLAIDGYKKIEDDLNKAKVITIIDFDLPSSKKRMWVLDINTQKVLFHTYVAHGRNSGNNVATKFSNVPQSNMSSLGFYLTGGTYQGKHGLSLYLDGLEQGVNDNARSRSIVIHGADYVSEGFVEKHGRLGRSFGCPALPLDVYREVIDVIADGSCLFINKSDNGLATI
jgi:hypothetical protein